jgi:hypothetical protein
MRKKIVNLYKKEDCEFCLLNVINLPLSVVFIELIERTSLVKWRNDDWFCW